jgi:5-formyltetrahydrofolate cyclo-ligase
MTSDIVETEWSGYHEDKDALRSAIWRRLKEQDVSPYEPFGHIPSFVGAEDAAALLAELPIWQEAQVIKSNPDTAHVPLRLRALQDGKRLYMAVPRLTEARCFVELTAEALANKGVSPEEAAAWQGAMAHGRLVSPEEMRAIDLVLVGCVAVSRRGGRIGKGAGFADLELGILRELDLIGPDTPVVAAVHPLQIIAAAAVPLQPHDFPLDWIITPAEVYETRTDYPRPDGLDWDQIRPEQYEHIPVLSVLKEQLQGN